MRLLKTGMFHATYGIGRYTYVYIKCPLNGDCREISVVYMCEVKTSEVQKEVYIELIEKCFETQLNGHSQSLTNRKYRNSTAFSSSIRELKERNINPTLKLSIVFIYK